jgi:hypothetical protein
MADKAVLQGAARPGEVNQRDATVRLNITADFLGAKQLAVPCRAPASIA